MIFHIDGLKLNGQWIEPKHIDRTDLVLIFLHEALGSIGQWKQFPQALCDSLHLTGFVYERQGHGLSDPLNERRTADYLHRYALDELPKVIDHILKAGQRAVLIGHSDGGSIALLYNYRYSSRVHSLVTMAAHVINEPETREGIQPAVEAFEAGKLDGLRKYHGAKTDQLVYAWANTWRDKSFIDWNLTSEIHSLNPALVIQGVNDQYGTEKQLDLIRNNYGENVSTMMIENCGHHPHLEQTENVLNTINKWFQELL